MSGTKRIITLVAAVCALTMGLAGCGGSKGSTAEEGQIITVGSKEPTNPLTPGQTLDGNAGQIINMLYSGLVSYDTDGNTRNEVAKSIEANGDSTEFTITLNQGWKFTDGTPVTAKSFSRAWSYVANVTNAQLGASFFSTIAGYDDLQKDGVDGDAQLSGLEVKDDYTLIVHMSQPDSVFPLKLGYCAFYPLPESFYDDPDGYAEHPVGNGPYKFSEWTHNSRIKIVRNADYDGPRKAKNDGITFKMYTDTAAAYSDVQSGNLDILTSLPSTALGSFQKNKLVKSYNQPGSSFVAMMFPPKSNHITYDEEGRLRRQAISKAIDRETIIEKILHGTATEATDFIAPTISGYSKDLKNVSNIRFDADAAKALWAEADQISPWSGVLEIDYPSDAPVKDWIEAIANNLRNTLGIEVKVNPYPTSKEYYTAMDNRQLGGMYRGGWAPDYPSAENYLVQLYSSSAADGKGGNSSDYKNPDFDAAMSAAAAASSVEEANKYYQEGEEYLLEDLPSIPLWYTNTVAVSVPGLKNVDFDFQSNPILNEITKE
ncbi:peptide ABC transporter substrate-binding protein [Bifidobacterium scardovii]|uniref:ABC transporter substrate-binding protein n=1 Tax=Bifidobacterium scardovii TaxID=158787 RepID=A0A087DFF2_9BIFI|nr:ABC transporter substrate-binding protein [Bifidobacterium scardovii]KFI94252.1 ABC transporter substrate-binding protein [Bifidobacterium scardovii]MDK6350197.1 ABC transporter substrate-binding protein [Bifidobacterium scardovii]BAQ31680.1 putative ABC transporter substrate binding component [Bifidobacterium scardovii JCM 12489 = DSM 13734]